MRERGKERKREGEEGREKEGPMESESEAASLFCFSVYGVYAVVV